MQRSIAPGEPYREFAPPRAWPHAVACIWTRGRGEYREVTERLVPPDNCGDLLLEVADDGGVVSCSIVGAMSRPLVASTSGHSIVGLRFRPGWFGPVLGVQAGELQDERVALADVAPALARSLGMGGSVDELFARWPGAAPGGAPRARVREAMALLDCGSGRVADVCRALQVSRQWLAREFERDVGVGPKVFARVSRVQRAVAAARRGESWSAIAYRLGYADQSHLAREVFALKGQRPTALSRSSRLVTRAPLALVAAD